MIPWTITYYSVFHPLTTFRYLYATMPPSTLSLVYFLDISLVGYCGAFFLCLGEVPELTYVSNPRQTGTGLTIATLGFLILVCPPLRWIVDTCQVSFFGRFWSALAFQSFDRYGKLEERIE